MVSLFPIKLNQPKIKVLFMGAVWLLLLISLNTSCNSSNNLDSRLDEIIKPYKFSIAEWEIEAISYEIEDFLFGIGDETTDDSTVVVEYFSIIRQINDLERKVEIGNNNVQQSDIEALKKKLENLRRQKDELEDRVEGVIQKQITEILRYIGIYHPLDNYLNLEFSFPPVNFELEKPPNLLVISPRDKIERIEELALVQQISPEERQQIEEAVDELGVSSIVVELGGMATYPSFVIDNAGLQFTINVAIEEWLHQYLFFRPLGFMYSLHLAGIAPDGEIAVLNETLVDIARQEIGDILYQNFYSPFFKEEELKTQEGKNQSDETEFDFYKEMREIRLVVDDYLARGEVDQAEIFMEQKRIFLTSKGYYIRRLNQAYFAFYGTYAAGPISVNPIGNELKAFRELNTSLSEFLNRVSLMTSRDDLKSSLE
ncbi:MAG: hypothetical protein JSV32_05790 [Dehalococcoidia bacterium]|nr:MAG: hypothetical protein JSV32_05790 [Dehalococcoidia bacterium]